MQDQSKFFWATCHWPKTCVAILILPIELSLCLTKIANTYQSENNIHTGIWLITCYFPSPKKSLNLHLNR